MKSIALVFAGMLLAALLYFAWNMLDMVSNKPASSIFSNKAPVKTFSDSRYGYEFDYPATWRKISGKNSTSIGDNLTVMIKRDNPELIAGIRVAEINTRSDFDTLSQTLDKKMSQSLSGFKKINDEFLKINGQKVLRYTYTYQSANNIVVKQMQQIAVKDGRAYYLIFHGYPSDFDSLESEINQIAASFRF